MRHRRILLALVVLLVAAACGADTPARPAATRPASDYGRVDVRELAKDPARFTDQLLSIEGEVFNFLSASGLTHIQLYVQWPGAESFEHEVVVVRTNRETTGIFKGDRLAVWGRVTGSFTGTNAFGGTITQPQIDAHRFERIP